MPRHYTDDEKRLVLDRLIINNFDVARTADEFKLPTATIYRWMNAANVTKPIHSQLQQQHQQQHSDSPPSLAGQGVGVGVNALPEEITDRLTALREEMLDAADTLSRSIIPAIEEAPLNQRVAALAQLIDRIIKLAAQLPAEEQEIEYVHEYEYEVEHHVEKKDETAEEDSYNSSPEDQTETQTTRPPPQSDESAGE